MRAVGFALAAAAMAGACVLFYAAGVALAGGMLAAGGLTAALAVACAWVGADTLHAALTIPKRRAPVRPRYPDPTEESVDEDWQRLNDKVTDLIRERNALWSERSQWEARCYDLEREVAKTRADAAFGRRMRRGAK